MAYELNIHIDLLLEVISSNVTAGVSNIKAKSQEPLLSADLAAILIYITQCALCQVICIFGVVSNVISIVCFNKQGFKDPVNASFVGLAVADLGCLITVMINNTLMTPALNSADLPFDVTECVYLTSGIMHANFTRITGWITALITMERCLCIIIPLKVKNLLTTKRVTVIIISVYVILLLSNAPVFVVNSLGMKYFPNKNKTVIGVIYKSGRATVEKYFFAINNALVPCTSFLIIIVCTVVLVVKLSRSNKWRKTSSVSAHGDSTYHRHQKVATMVVMISTLFIICFIPLSFLFIAMSLFPEFSFDGREKNLLLTVGGCVVILESVNSSSNIFIYYNMSTRYRSVFRHLLCGE